MQQFTPVAYFLPIYCTFLQKNSKKIYIIV